MTTKAAASGASFPIRQFRLFPLHHGTLMETHLGSHNYFGIAGSERGGPRTLRTVVRIMEPRML